MAKNDFIAIDVPGIEYLAKQLVKLPGEIADEGINQVNRYLINVVKEYAPYQYVTRAQAYPDAIITFPSGKQLAGWHSIKQFRYVMAKISSGEIRPGRPNRNQNLRAGWEIIGSGRNSIIANEVPYAPYVQGDSRSEQARMMRIIGWRGTDQIVKDRLDQIARKFEAGANKAIKRLR